jgi:hypothetical protein
MVDERGYGDVYRLMANTTTTTRTITTAFGRWLDTFLSEKGIGLDEVLEVDGPSGTNWMPVGVLASIMKDEAPAAEQAGIKSMLVRIDFRNGDVRDYLRHLARAVAR